MFIILVMYNAGYRTDNDCLCGYYFIAKIGINRYLETEEDKHDAELRRTAPGTKL